MGFNGNKSKNRSGFRPEQRSGFRSEGSGQKSYSSGGGRDSGNKMLTKATCDSCGSYCKVPFKPSGEKPVYCNDCYRKNGAFSDSKPARFGQSFGSNRNESGAESKGSGADLDQINAKLDRILRLLED
ncbi:hypothetical protein HOG98_03580 [bacterium]|jgi:CxxC-x17-CxxC domain-containing protein|nr:hypothetical protein [bacterium]